MVGHEPKGVTHPRNQDDVPLPHLRHHPLDVDALVQADESDVALHRPLNLETLDFAQARGEIGHPRVIHVNHGTDFTVRRERRGCQGARLPHRAAASLAKPPAFRDELPGTDDDASDGCAQSLGQAHGHRVRSLHGARRRHPERRRRVPYPRAVEVQGDAALPRELAALVHVVQRQHATAALVVCLLQAQDLRHREVLIVRPNRARDFLHVERSIRAVRQRPRVSSHQRRQSALLVDVDVGQRAADEFRAAHLAVHSHGDQVTHRPGWHEQGGRFPKRLGHLLLQLDHRRVVPEDVVANLRLRHRPPHRRRGLCHRVRSHVDHFRALLPRSPRAHPGAASARLCLLRRGGFVRVRPDSVVRTVLNEREEAGVVVDFVGHVARPSLASHSVVAVGQRSVLPVLPNVLVPRLGQRLQRVGVLLGDVIGDGSLARPPMVAENSGLLTTGERRRRALLQPPGVADAANDKSAVLLIGLVEIVAQAIGKKRPG